jgi:hypothetical protein
MTNVKVLMSSSYDPQMDGQTKRVNQCLKTFLRCFVHACPRQLSKWLALVEYWYNISLQSALGRSLLYGHSPRHFGLQPEDSCQVQELNSWLQERELMSQVIKHHLLRAQERMKLQADKKRSEIHFDIGDKVFLKL